MERGFPESEFETRLSKARAQMNEKGLDALFLTNEADFRYFTGFLTRFWESPTRPWYLIIPLDRDPIAVIPSIGEALFKRVCNFECRCWRAPDYEDDGISCLIQSFQDRFPNGARIGVPSEIETHLRMPLRDFETLKEQTQMKFLSDSNIMKSLRMIKSPLEISKIEHACQIANRTFARVPEIAKINTPLSDIFRKFQSLCLEEGADYVPYLAGAAGFSGYEDVISPASERPLQEGDILMLDTGLVWDGYFCDFDRNFAIGYATDPALQAHEKLLKATQAAFASARPGAKMSEIFEAAISITSPGSSGNDAGRFGHGVGMQLTEPPSLIPADETICQEGMVLTLEPSIEVEANKILVHEENILITKKQARWLSKPYKALEII